MRKTETERLEQLRAKLSKGEQLKPNEQKRYDTLINLEKEESEKNGRGNNNNSGSGDSKDSGDGSGESQSTQQGDGNKLDPKLTGNGGQAAGDNSENVSSNRQNGNGSGSSGTESGGLEGKTAGNNSDRGSGETGEEGILPKNTVDHKPRNVKPKRVKKNSGIDINPNDMMGAIIMSGFSLIASVSHKDYWNISDDEADSIANPLVKILDDLSPKQKKYMEKYTNPIILASSLAGIVIPRVMMDMEGRKKHEAAKRISGTQQKVQSISTDTSTKDVQQQVIPTGGNKSNVKTIIPVAPKELAELIGTSNQ